MATADPLIALDAMGGDFAPPEIVKGAVMAARDLGVRVALVGRPEPIVVELAKHGPKPETVSVVPASEALEMGEKPAPAGRRQPGGPPGWASGPSQASSPSSGT